jgi:hypothetical protein
MNMATTYVPPVDKLLTYGEPELNTSDKWPDYLELGLKPEHIPDLIRMARDEELNNADSESLEVWAPLHAIRALGQLRDTSAIEPLLSLFDNLTNDEWLMEDLPRTYGLIGPAAIPALAAHVANRPKEEFSRTFASNGLVEIAKMHPEARSEVISTISKLLESFDEEDPEVNAFLISDLGELKAVETLPLIERAFNADAVDESIIDLDDVLIDFGLKEREPWPEPVLAPVSPLKQMISSTMHHSHNEDEHEHTISDSVTAVARVRISHKSGASQKNKNKMAKQSRKKNRRKKK